MLEAWVSRYGVYRKDTACEIRELLQKRRTLGSPPRSRWPTCVSTCKVNLKFSSGQTLHQHFNRGEDGVGGAAAGIINKGFGVIYVRGPSNPWQESIFFNIHTALLPCCV